MPGWEPISEDEWARHSIYTTADFAVPEPLPLSTTDWPLDRSSTERTQPDVPLIVLTDWDQENDPVDRSHPEASMDAVVCRSFAPVSDLQPRCTLPDIGVAPVQWVYETELLLSLVEVEE
nr:hypothetical protein B0A51_05554 [Rachicladosporium sp. CCFEE 5018]